MKTKETTESEKLQLDAEEIKNQSLIERVKVEDSPFEIISMEGYHFGVMGDYRLTEKSNDIEEIKKNLESITWNRLIQVIMILDELKEKHNDKLKNINE
jgi:hypothetical protein